MSSRMNGSAPAIARKTPVTTPTAKVECLTTRASDPDATPSAAMIWARSQTPQRQQSRLDDRLIHQTLDGPCWGRCK